MVTINEGQYKEKNKGLKMNKGGTLWFAEFERQIPINSSIKVQKFEAYRKRQAS